MSRWWRAYDEAVDDPKLILLSDKAHRAWFNLMCIASANGGILPNIKVIAVKLRVSTQRAAAAITELVSAGLLDKRDDGGFEPHNWAGRQFISDSSAERVKRHREKRAAAGLQSQWTAPKALRQAVYERDGFACVYCGDKDRLSLDHRTPEIRGGTHDIDNLATACLACNGAKRDMTETEFRESVTLLKRPQRTEAENREQKGSEAVASAAVPAPTDDPRKRLFSHGLETLRRLTGKGPDSCRSFLGKCLKAADDNAIVVLGLIEDAERNEAVDPAAYITARLKPREEFHGRPNQVGGGSVALAAKRLAEQWAADDSPGNPDAVLSLPPRGLRGS